MSIKFEHNDLTTVEKGIIAHCVNTLGAMGAGVARALFMKWPEVRSEYLKMPTGKQMLGTWHQVYPAGYPELVIANVYGQEFCGHDGGKYADIDSLRRGLLPVFDLAKTTGKTLYLPRIGSDLAGLDWNTETLPMIMELCDVFPDVDVIVYTWP